MIAQRGIMANGNVQPIRYDALEQCLTTVSMLRPHSVHMPRIGCGLAGGEWSMIEPIILRTFSGLDVYVYDYEKSGPENIAWKP